jgi:undecaprenyl-diphosphatase
MHPIILGIIQGLTEFLPISSSGHLLIIPYLFHWPPSGLTFDVALNTGTFIAVLLYFFPVWWGLLTKGLIQRQAKELRLLGLLLLATIPAAVIGYWGEPIIADTLRKPLIASIMLIGFGVVLYFAERVGTNKRDMNQLSWSEALIIGLTQSLALIPGVSRSGITITSGLLLGLTKEEATEFSFLLLAPISLGAAITQVPAVLQSSLIEQHEMLIGTIVSFLVGIAAIHLMLRFIKKYGFAPYIWYRIVVGTIFLLLIVFG